MENMVEDREQKRLRGEQELLDMHFRDVLPAEIEVDRKEVASLISEYIKDFQRVYSQVDRTENTVQLLSLGLSVDSLRERARSELAILDKIMPIEGTIRNLIPWDVADVEAIFYESTPARETLTWARFAHAMGKRMSASYPVEED